MTDLVLDCPLTSDSGANSATAMTVETVTRTLCISNLHGPGAWLKSRERIGCPSQSGQADWGSRLREARNKVLTLHAIPNFYFSYELRRSGGADARRAHYAALFHQRLHFT